jgi:flavin-dependent dehydrogenase
MKVFMAALILGTLPVAFAFSGNYLDNLASKQPAEATSPKKSKGSPSYLDQLTQPSHIITGSGSGMTSYADALGEPSEASEKSLNSEKKSLFPSPGVEANVGKVTGMETKSKSNTPEPKAEVKISESKPVATFKVVKVFDPPANKKSSSVAPASVGSTAAPVKVSSPKSEPAPVKVSSPKSEPFKANHSTTDAPSTTSSYMDALSKHSSTPSSPSGPGMGSYLDALAPKSSTSSPVKMMSYAVSNSVKTSPAKASGMGYLDSLHSLASTSTDFPPANKTPPSSVQTKAANALKGLKKVFGSIKSKPAIAKKKPVKEVAKAPAKQVEPVSKKEPAKQVEPVSKKEDMVKQAAKVDTPVAKKANGKAPVASTLEPKKDPKMQEKTPIPRFFMEDADAKKGASTTSPIKEGAGITERMLKKVPSENQAGGAGGSSTFEAFKRAEENWTRLKAFKAFKYDSKLLRWDQNGNPPPKQFVTSDGAFGNPKCWAKLAEQKNKELDFDAIVIGGTLGIFYATYLQLQGHDVCVVEAGKLRGREQEWNISMDELLELVELGVLTQEDVDEVITTEFPACRSGFKNQEVTPLAGGYFDNGVGFECETRGVLNLGVAPAILLERVAARFKAIGGVIREQTRLQGVCVSELVGSAIDLGDDQEPITARLVLDSMGNASPISAQQRYGMKPDGVCAVVGSCAGGYDKKTNTMGDIIYTNDNIVDKSENGHLQYFWEAFPVGIGRNGKEPGTSDVKTTYMFTYMDADENRPSLEDMMEDYWKTLPTYQPSITNPETDLDIKRILFAYFPTYRDSPLKPQWSRILAVGDASGIQSPLSFGGFGALTRHLDRVGGAISEALDNDCLHKDDLGEINAYMPNLSAAWMFQKAMSVSVGKKPNPEFVNRLLSTNFEVMDEMGQRTIKPFLQDVVRFDGLVGSLAKSFAKDPTFMPEIIATVGLPALVDWMGHLGNVSTRHKYAWMGSVNHIESIKSHVCFESLCFTFCTDGCILCAGCSRLANRIAFC